MALPIEGFTVVAKSDRIQEFLDSDSVAVPNGTELNDKHIWRCCFMAEADAQNFANDLERLGLNISQGPDSDVVIVSEFSQEIVPYCEWLQLAQWEKAVIAWLAGTEPEKVIAREGWDPKRGSGLVFQNPSEMDDLEFLRVDNNVEVYLNKKTGKEVFLGRSGSSPDMIFKTATQTIRDHWVETGEDAVTGKAREEVFEAVKLLEQAITKVPDWWNAHWFMGKGCVALGDYESAERAFSKAYEIEKSNESVPRELTGVLLELGKFDQAVKTAEGAATLVPDNAETLCNLALTYLLAGKNEAASKTIAASLAIDSSDEINRRVEGIIADVIAGRRSRPSSLRELMSGSVKRKAWWQFWK